MVYKLLCAKVPIFCASHALNLVICAECSVGDTRNCFGTVKETVIFFRKSAMRSEALRGMIGSMYPQSKRKRLLQSVRNSLGESTDGLLSFVDLFEAVIATLKKLKTKVNLQRSTQASNFLHALLSPSFLVRLHFTEHVQAMTMPCPLSCRQKDEDISAAIKRHRRCSGSNTKNR
ncbi:hypothetical protein HPB48_016962 [Haemaphysalis longicornis]|uniref:Uncharacterized protein n=1 Tax=Haemaphysalis longicornis TaxID=44386 RepID=A0A9J6FCE2_HAELO|nr:hypothetical protein HPB48_016962 [Haemaphysalis longicornis]